MVDLPLLRVLDNTGAEITDGATILSDASDATYLSFNELQGNFHIFFDATDMVGLDSVGVRLRYLVVWKPPGVDLGFNMGIRDKGSVSFVYGTCLIQGPEQRGDYPLGTYVDSTIFIDEAYLNNNYVWLPDSTPPYTVEEAVTELTSGVDGEGALSVNIALYGSGGTYEVHLLSATVGGPVEQEVILRTNLSPKQANFDLSAEVTIEIETPQPTIIGPKAASFALRTEVPVVPAPESPDGGSVIVAEATGAFVLSGSQPTYSVSSASAPRPRQRITADGVDITYFRGAVTPNVVYTLTEPFLYGPGSLDLPQVFGCFERLGVGPLSFLRPGAVVEVQYVLDDVVVSTAYKGVMLAFNLTGATLAVELGGELSGRAAVRDRQVPIFPRINDLGHQMADGVRDLGLPFNPPLGPETGIQMMTTGGTGHLDWLSDVVARAWTRAGRKWTVMPDEATGVYEAHRKDTTTIHATAFLDDAHTLGNLRRDIAEEPNRIFGSGVTPKGQRVRNGVYPGLIQGPPPPFPGDMEQGDTGPYVQILIMKLHSVGYLKLSEAGGGYDDDVYDAVVELQNDAGLFDDGFSGTTSPGKVDEATWNALYDLDVTTLSTEYAHIEPMAERQKVKKWRRSGTGQITRPNPNYDPTVLVRDRTIDFGAGLTRSQMRKYAHNELYDSNDPNWIGDITFTTGALIKGEGTVGMTVTVDDIFPATDLRPGMNVWLPTFDGGVLVHVSACAIDLEGVVSATVDTRARDAMEAWEVIARNDETKNSPSRRSGRRQRSSTVTKDSIGEWDEIGGLLGQDVELNWGWNVFQVVAAMEGTVSRIRLKINSEGGGGETKMSAEMAFGSEDGGTPFEFVTAVFGRPITVKMLNTLVPDALAPGADKNWQTNRKQLKDHWILFAAGTNEEPCGYSPGTKKDGDPLTGLFEDDAGFAYRSETRTLLHVAVFLGEAGEGGGVEMVGPAGTESGALLQSGRIMWNQLEAGV